MKKQLLTLGIALLVTCGLYAQENQEFKPSGKLDGRIFANFNTQIGAEDMNPSAFVLERAYFGYTYKMAPDFSARILLDIDNDLSYASPKTDTTFTAKSSKRNAFFKNAAIFYTKDGLKVGLGIQGTFSMKYQEKVWGRRYVSKSYLDLNKFSPTADLGVSAEYTSDMFAFDIAIFNGEGYQVAQPEDDNDYKISTGAALFLMDKDLILRGVNEYKDNGIVMNSTTFFAGYSADAFTLGFEYNTTSNFGNADGIDRSGFSAYGSYNLSEKIAIFGRYDDVETSTVTKADNSLIIGGVEYKILKNLKVAANAKHFEFKLDGLDSETFAFLNFEARF